MIVKAVGIIYALLKPLLVNEDLLGSLRPIPRYKRNHFVPKALIRRFRVGKGVRLFSTVSFKLKEQSNPNSIFYVDHLYSRWRTDGSRDTTTEIEFQRDHENDLTHFIDDLIGRINGSKPLDLNRSEREYLIRLTVRLLLRNPYFFNFVSRTWKFRAAKWIFWLSLKLRKKARVSIMETKLSINEAIESEMRAFAATSDISAVVSALGEGRRILFLTPRQDSQAFVLGNQPCLLQRKKWYQDGSDSWRSEMGDMDIYAVLDPFLMVGLVSTPSTEDVIIIDHDDVKRINGLIVKYSSEVVARSSSDLVGSWYRLFDGEDQIRLDKDLPKETRLVRLTVEVDDQDQQD